MKNTKTLSLFIFLCLLSSQSFSQIDFEKGYFISNKQGRQECLIKNKDWRFNPTAFEYKLAENSTVSKLDIEEVSEFGIYGVSKYLRQEIEIDRSEDQKQKLGFSREPKWSEETLFLKVLLEGETSLFSYQDGSILRYFFQVKDSEIEQLINKAYYTEGSKSMRWNDGFKQQLWSKANCSGLPMDEFKDLAYTQKTLLRYVKKENSCQGNEVEEIKEKVKRDAFNLKIAGGLRYSTVYGKGTVSTTTSVFQVDQFFGKKFSARLGLEFEYILPFNKNKWSIFGGPNFQYFQSEQEHPRLGAFLIDYKSIELVTGIRHYIYLRPDFKLFTNLSFSYDYTLSSSDISYENTYGSNLQLFTTFTLEYGVGAILANKLSLEFRSHRPRTISGFINYNMKFRSYSLILGYTLL